MAKPTRVTSIGRYELHSLLGRGASGEVWQAVLVGPEGFRKPCAVKLLRVAGSHQGLASEARLGALLSHPNVLATYELGEADDTWFVAMELVDGASLSQLLRDGPLSGRAVLDLAQQVCAGLAHIHGMGLVHRDIKPGNLLVDRCGLVKIGDLGIARLASETPDSSAGTPGYMPPEQHDGNEDHRADLFALGATLYALIAGASPLGRGLPAVARAHRVERLLAEPGFLDPLDQAIDGLGEVVRRCLRHAPDDRWDSAGRLAAALRALTPPPGPTLLERLLALRPELRTDEGATLVPTTTVAEHRRLPPRRDAFVGRQAETRDLRARVEGGPGLVTLTGPGGMGKTRLAVEIAWQVALPGGALFCALEDATSREGLCQVVASTLGLPLADGDPVEQVGLALRGRGRVLVVLDNLEQVVQEAAHVLDRWRALAPEATLLATSRVALRIRSEALVVLEPLSLPDAVALFEARAHRAGEPDQVRSLVERLDRMPLAIELAAARTRLLPVSEVLSRLDDRFRLLASGSRDLPARHRSLRASLEGSWELLDPEARAALAQLSVFVGGFTVEAAEAVVDLDGAWVLDALEALVEHSLVRRTTGDRFGLLVSVAAYAAEHLDPEARRAAEARHGAFFASYGSADSLRALRSRGGLTRLRALAEDLDNLVVASRRANARQDGPTAAGAALGAYAILRLRGPLDRADDLLEAVSALSDVPRLSELLLARAEVAARGRISEAEALARQALASEDPHIRASARYRLGVLAEDAGRTDEAEQWLTEAREGFRQVGDEGHEGSALAALGILMRHSGRIREARALYEQALEKVRSAGARVTEAVVLANLASVVEDLGEPERARGMLEAALAAHREIGNPRYEALVLASLASLHSDHGRPDEALAFYTSAIETHRRVGNRRDLGSALGNLALLHRDQGQTEAGIARAQEALALHRELHNPLAEAVALGNLGLLHEDAGRVDEALSCFERAIAAATAFDDPVWIAIERGYRGRLHLEQGDLQAAATDLQAAVDGARDRHLPAWASFLADLAVLRARAGEGEQARADLEAAEAVLKPLTGDLTLRALLCRARVHLALGERERATEALAQIDEARLPRGAPMRRLYDRVARESLFLLS